MTPDRHEHPTGALPPTNIRHLIFALSDALDLVGIDDVAHGKRVGIMAAECAKADPELATQGEALFDLGLLHDIGVSSTVTHGHLVQEFNWDRSQIHCEVGYALLKDFPRLAWMALPIKYHHTRWDKLPLASLGEPIATQANLIYLVDRVDALAAPHYADGSLLMHTQNIRQQIADFSGSFFAPHLVDLFLQASKSEAFWLSLEPRVVQSYLLSMLSTGQSCTIEIPELKQLARIFSKIVDAKSPFTAEHSIGVAAVARHLAEQLGVCPENRDKLEIAGLLHDIGKLRIPDEILDKPGKLDERERKIMNSHSFESFQILRHIAGFEEISTWAAYHHEEPTGNGYPFHLDGNALPLEAQILQVADIFQAMVQDRPYRAGLAEPQVFEFMSDLVSQGRIDADIFAVLKADLPHAIHLARNTPDTTFAGSPQA